MVKSLPAMQETQILSLGQEDPLEKGIATHSSILAWRSPWTEEPGGLQSMGSQSVGQDWVTSISQFLSTWTDSLWAWFFSFFFPTSFPPTLLLNKQPPSPHHTRHHWVVHSHISQIFIRILFCYVSHRMWFRFLCSTLPRAFPLGIDLILWVSESLVKKGI